VQLQPQADRSPPPCAETVLPSLHTHASLRDA
jgi:hypothetical protein